MPTNTVATAVVAARTVLTRARIRRIVAVTRSVTIGGQPVSGATNGLDHSGRGSLVRSRRT